MLHTFSNLYRKYHKHLVLGGASSIYLGLFLISSFFFSRQPINFLRGTEFGFAEFEAFTFLCLGALIWYYAIDRRVACLFFLFNQAFCYTFAIETLAIANLPLFSFISGTLSLLAACLLSILFLFFPLYTLSGSHSSNENSSFTWSLTLRLYIVLIILLALIGNISIFFYFFICYFYLLRLIHVACVALCILCIFIRLIYIYHHAQETQRQQCLIFFLGLALSILFFLVLTVLPQLFSRSSAGLPGEITTMSFIFIPLTLAYAILRYQVIAFDSLVERHVTLFLWVCFAILIAYVDGLVLHFHPSFFTPPLLLLANGAASIACYTFAKKLAATIIFPDIHIHRYGLYSYELEPLDIQEAASLLLFAVKQQLQVPHVFLFTYDLIQKSYRLYTSREPSLDFTFLFQCIRQYLPSLASHFASEHLFYTTNPFIGQLSILQAPCYLSELVGSESLSHVHKAKSLIPMAPTPQNDLWLFPIHLSGTMIGFLALGKQINHLYNGHDREILSLLLARYTPILDLALTYTYANTMLSFQSQLSISHPGHPDPSPLTITTITSLAAIYGQILAHAMLGPGSVEIWIDEAFVRMAPSTQEKNTSYALHRIFTSTDTTHTTPFPIGHVAAYSRTPLFLSETKEKIQPFLPSTPQGPVAVLPLYTDQQDYGLLLLCYTNPHFFTDEEQTALRVFAQQYSGALERTILRTTLQETDQHVSSLLQSNYPSTMIESALRRLVGYADLLSASHDHLSADQQALYQHYYQRSMQQFQVRTNFWYHWLHDHNQPDFQPIALHSALLSAFHSFAGNTGDMPVHCDIDIPEPIMIRTDLTRLDRILLALFDHICSFYSPYLIKISIDAIYKPLSAHEHTPSRVQVKILYERDERDDQDKRWDTPDQQQGETLRLFQTCRFMLQEIDCLFQWEENQSHTQTTNALLLDFPLMTQAQRKR